MPPLHADGCVILFQVFLYKIVNDLPNARIGLAKLYKSLSTQYTVF